MVERLVIFSWNSGWYDSIVDGLVYTYVQTNKVITAEDGKNHLYTVKEWISAGKNDSRYEKVVKLDIDYSKEVLEEGVGNKIIAILIALGLSAIAFTILIKTVGEQAGALGGLGIIFIIILILIAIIFGGKK
jgi:hypothetical protein